MEFAAGLRKAWCRCICLARLDAAAEPAGDGGLACLINEQAAVALVNDVLDRVDA